MREAEGPMYASKQKLDSEEVQELRKEGGRWLKGLREERGLSQRELTLLVTDNAHPTFISQVEIGKARIPPDRYEDWAKALGMSAPRFVQAILRFYDPVTHRILFGTSGETVAKPPTLAGKVSND